MLLGSRYKEWVFELIAIGVLLLSVSLPFSGALQNGKTLSKLALLRDIDLTQDANKTFAIHGDPSQATTHTPNERFVETAGEIPLWNPLNGGGRPMIGDFQTLIFSFFHEYFPSNNAYKSTLGILFKLMLGAAGAYFFSRILGLSRFASLACGQAFGLTQHCLTSLELCTNYCFYPWLLLAAVWSLHRPTPARTVLMALLCAASAYNMHPETFVCGVAGALLFAACRKICNRSVSDFWVNTKIVIVWLLSVSSLTFLLTAPLILPFCEFILNGISYKFVDAQLEFISLTSFLSNLIAPFSASSTFVGLVLAACMPIGLLCCWSKDKAVILALIATVLFTTRPGPLEAILGHKPISFLLPEYTTYFCILFASITGGAGLDELMASSKKWLQLKLLLIPASALVFAWLLNNPTISEKWSDLTSFGYNENFSLFSLSQMIVEASTMIVLLMVAFCRQELVKKLALPIYTLLIVLNLIPLLQDAGHELPTVSAYWYRTPEIATLLKSKQTDSYRATATGDHLLQPNTNLIFGFDDFRCTAPLHPRRYADFADACGIKSRNCNIYTSPYDLKNLYDLASVKLIASEAPVHSADPILSEIEMGASLSSAYEGKPIKIRPGLRLEQASFKYFPKSFEVNGEAQLTLHMCGRYTYYSQWILLDEKDQKLWRSSWQESTIEQSGEPGSKHTYKISMSAPLPSNLQTGSIRVLLRIRSGSSVENKNWHDRTMLLSKIQLERSQDKRVGRIERIAQSSDGLQLYLNHTALPAAYMVHQVHQATDQKTALSMLKDPTLDLQHTAIIETDSRASTTEAVSAPLPAQPDMVRLLSKFNNSVEVLTHSNSPGYLVLTDTFYPGWTVFVDGKPGIIRPANSAFRAVYLAAGKHIVDFEYMPQTLVWGLHLADAGLATAFIILLWQSSLALRDCRKAPQNSGMEDLTDNDESSNSLKNEKSYKLPT